MKQAETTVKQRIAVRCDEIKCNLIKHFLQSGGDFLRHCLFFNNLNVGGGGNLGAKIEILSTHVFSVGYLQLSVGKLQLPALTFKPWTSSVKLRQCTSAGCWCNVQFAKLATDCGD